MDFSFSKSAWARQEVALPMPMSRMQALEILSITALYQSEVILNITRS